MNLATRLRWLRRLGLACVGLTVVLMGLGAWVKANGAGLSCPDWPQCYGEWLPPFPAMPEGQTPGIQGPGADHAEAYTHAQVLYEWTHRLVASVVGLFVGTFALVAAKGRELARPTRHLPAVAFCLVIFQAVLGGITVKVGNTPEATTAHLVTAVVFLLVLTVATCFAFLRPLPLDAPITTPKRKIEVVYRDQPTANAAATDHE